MHSFDDLHDERLVARSQAGDRGALDLLIRRYLRGLYTVAMRMLGDPAAARLAVRAALIRTHDQLVLRRRDMGFFHAAHRMLIDECLQVATMSTDPIACIDIRRLTFDERRRCMQDAILHLPPDQRAVLLLRHDAGLSYNETAIMLNLSRERARARLHNARQQLGERLMGWIPRIGLPPEAEGLLQDAIDGELAFAAREDRDRLLGERPDAHARAAALRELGHLLNSLGPTEPPADLASDVLSQIRD